MPMSIWDRLRGVLAGLATGGPVGALLGAVTARLERQREARGERDIAFTIGVIALSAKMAKADGEVTDEEIAAFGAMFSVPPREVENVRRVYDLARKDVAGFDAYARQIARLFETGAPILEDLLDGLFTIAKADGTVHASELAFLEEVARIFGFEGPAFERIAARHVGDERLDPYTVLGVSPGASETEIKAAWRALVKENHPDMLIARGVPQEFVALANDRLAAINAAYDRVAGERAAAM